MLTATSNVEQQLRIEIVVKIRFKSSIKPFPLVFVHPNIGFSLLESENQMQIIMEHILNSYTFDRYISWCNVPD